MYWPEVYHTFCQLRKQYYKLKTWKWADKYSKIEFEQRKYITFKRFYNTCNEYFSRRYIDEPTQETCQDVFEQCLEWSQQKVLKKILIP